MVPVPKAESDLTNVGSYRPISLPPCVGKIYKSVINKTLYQYLESQLLLADTQHGKQSTLDCLIAQYQEWVKLLSQGHGIRHLSVDIKKAFYRVWHKRLLCKLKYYGIDGRLFEVLADFPRPWSVQVVLDGIISKEHPVLSGVSQGSNLGPTLFLVFINDLGDNLVTNLTTLLITRQQKHQLQNTKIPKNPTRSFRLTWRELRRGQMHGL